MWAKKQLLVVWGHIKTTLHYKDCLEDHSSWQVVIRISIYKPWSSAIWKGNVAKLTGLTNNCSSARSQVLGMILQVCHRPIPRNLRTRQNLFPTVSITSWICGGWNDQRNGGFFRTYTECYLQLFAVTVTVAHLHTLCRFWNMFTRILLTFLYIQLLVPLIFMGQLAVSFRVETSHCKPFSPTFLHKKNTKLLLIHGTTVYLLYPLIPPKHQVFM